MIPFQPTFTNSHKDKRIMKVPGGGFERCYNAQAAVATDSMLVVPRVLRKLPTTNGKSNPFAV